MPEFLHKDYLNQLDDSFIRASRNLVKNYASVGESQPVLARQFDERNKNEVVEKFSGHLSNINVYLDEIIAFSLGEQFEQLDGGALDDEEDDSPLRAQFGRAQNDDEDENFNLPDQRKQNAEIDAAGVQDRFLELAKDQELTEDDLDRYFENGEKFREFINETTHLFNMFYFQSDEEDEALFKKMDDKLLAVIENIKNPIRQDSPPQKPKKGRKPLVLSPSDWKKAPTEADIILKYPTITRLQRRAQELGLDITRETKKKNKNNSTGRTNKSLPELLSEVTKKEAEMFQEQEEPEQEEPVQEEDFLDSFGFDFQGSEAASVIPAFIKPIAKHSPSYNSILQTISKCQMEVNKAGQFFKSTFMKEVSKLKDDEIKDIRQVLNDIGIKLDELDDIMDREVYDLPTEKLLKKLIGTMFQQIEEIERGLNSVKILYTVSTPNEEHQLQGSGIKPANEFQFYFNEYKNMPMKYFL